MHSSIWMLNEDELVDFKTLMLQMYLKYHQQYRYIL